MQVDTGRNTRLGNIETRIRIFYKPYCHMTSWQRYSYKKMTFKFTRKLCCHGNTNMCVAHCWEGVVSIYLFMVGLLEMS